MTTNRQPAPCVRCGQTVKPGEGLILGPGTGREWRVVHEKCIPEYKETD